MNPKYAFTLVSLTSLGALTPPKARANPVPCHYVSVDLQSALPAKAPYSMHGVGWVVSAEDKLFVLTPAHVSAGTGTLTAHCDGNNYALKARGASGTLDLSLFEITNPDKNLEPAVSFPLPKQNYTPDLSVPALMFALVKPGQESTVTTLDAFGGVFDPSKGVPRDLEPYVNSPVGFGAFPRGGGPVDNPLAPSKQVLFMNDAIQPGWSGSPVLAGSGVASYVLASDPTQTRYYMLPAPLGMLTKVHVNDKGSIAIPLSVITDAMPAMLKGEDPWRGAHPNEPWVEFFDEMAGAQLERLRRLHIPNADGSELTLSETCLIGAYASASNWDAGRRGDWGDGGGDWDAGRRGDWGDGGDTGRAANAETGAELGNLKKVLADSWSHALYYKSLGGCALEGLKLSDGRRLIGVSDASSGEYYKVTAVEDISNVVFNAATRAKFLAGRDHDWIYSDNFEGALGMVCRKDLLGSHLTALEGGAPLRTVVVGTSTEFTFPFIVASSLKSAMSKTREYNLKCDPKKSNLHVRNLLPNLFGDKAPFSYELNWSSDRVAGWIDFGPGCRAAIDEARTKFWSYDYHGDAGDVEFTLSPDRLILMVNVINVNPKCLAHPEQKTWITRFEGIVSR